MSRLPNSHAIVAHSDALAEDMSAVSGAAFRLLKSFLARGLRWTEAAQSGARGLRKRLRPFIATSDSGAARLAWIWTSDSGRIGGYGI